MTQTFTWCPSLNAARARAPRIASILYGDGYAHRATLGINVMQDVWSLAFAGDAQKLAAIDSFLSDNAVPGFWWTPPGSAGQILATVDAWNLAWTDRGGNGLLLGSITVEFRRSYNLQPGAA